MHVSAQVGSSTPETGASAQEGPTVPVTAEDCEPALALFRALSSPVRLVIVNLLAATPDLCVHDIVDALNAPQPLVSQHLKVLRLAGVVKRKRFGREMRYSLTDHHVMHIVMDAMAHALEDHGEDPAPH